MTFGCSVNKLQQPRWVQRRRLSLLLLPITKLQKLYADHRTGEAEAVYMLEPDRFALTLQRSAGQWSEPRVSRGAIVETIPEQSSRKQPYGSPCHLPSKIRSLSSARWFHPLTSSSGRS